MAICKAKFRVNVLSIFVLCVSLPGEFCRQAAYRKIVTDLAVFEAVQCVASMEAVRFPLNEPRFDA